MTPSAAPVRPLARAARIACIAAALLAQPVFADPVSRPFKASLATQEAIGFNLAACPAPPFLRGATTGSGTATELGKVELAATDCINPGIGVFTFTHGKLVLTAANGDTLTADYSGSLLPHPLSPTSVLSGSFRVTGGTGRFSGATGAGYLTGSENLATGKGTFVAAGTVAY